MDHALQDDVIRTLIAMKMANAKPSEMLRYITEMRPEGAKDWVASMMYFRRAFDLSIKQVSPILGWHMGELNDSQLDNFLLAEVYFS